MRMFASAMLFILGGMTYAADVNGTWTGFNTGPQGEFPLTFNFKIDGTTLTGSSTVGVDRSEGLRVMQRSEGQIKNGTIDGSTIIFTVTYDFGGKPGTVWYQGIVDSDQLRIDGGSCEMPVNWNKGEKGWDCPPPGFRFWLPLKKVK